MSEDIMEYDIIPGRGSKNAKKALALAEERGFDPSEVLTFRGGYQVPVVVDPDEKVEDATPEEVEDDESKTQEDGTEDKSEEDKSEEKTEDEGDKPAPKTTTARKRAAKKE